MRGRGRTVAAEILRVPILVIVNHELGEGASKMAFAQGDDAIEVFPFQGAYEA
jgi:hypothetical protein